MGVTVSTVGAVSIYNSNYRGNVTLRAYYFRDNSSEFEFSNSNNPYSGTVPDASNNGSCANTDKLIYISWPLETVNSACNVTIPNAKGLVRVFKLSNGIYQDYFHITDPAVALNDYSYIVNVKVVCHKDLFIIGLPYADINGEEKGKVIIGKMK